MCGVRECTSCDVLARFGRDGSEHHRAVGDGPSVAAAGRVRTVLASLLALVPAFARADDYAERGTFELGANAGLMLAPELRNINVAPFFGWFVSDNLELSAIAAVSNIAAGDDSATVFSSLVEPSYHVPIDPGTFAFVGMGVGVAYENDLGAGLVVAPRIGANVVMGRRSVLTPSLSYEYTTHNVDADEMKNVALVAVASALRMNIGYTAMW